MEGDFMDCEHQQLYLKSPVESTCGQEILYTPLGWIPVSTQEMQTCSISTTDPIYFVSVIPNHD